LWVSSLTIDTEPPPPPIVLFTQDEGWHEMIKNPRWGHGDAVFEAGANDATGPNGLDNIPMSDGRPNRVIWDALDIRVEGDIPYSTIVVTTSPTLGWFGQGSISETAAGANHINMNWSGGGNPARIPLTSNIYEGTVFFNPEKFVGFFIQSNHGQTNPDQANTPVSITRIVLE
jgi:hypothetical protein